MAQAVPAQIESVQVDSATTSALAPGVAPLGNTFQAPPDLVAPKRLPAHYLWAVLIARIYEVLTGLWRRNPHPTMRSISASTGD